MTTIRSAIVDDIETVITAIPGIASVHVWMPAFVDGEMLADPFANIAPMRVTDLSDESGFSLRELTVDVQVFVSYDGASETDNGWSRLDPLLAAIEEALCVDVHRGQTNGTVIDTFCGSFEIRPHSETNSYLVAVMPVRVRYRQQFGKPEDAP